MKICLFRKELEWEDPRSIEKQEHVSMPISLLKLVGYLLLGSVQNETSIYILRERGT
nr:MAG TPA: hypothetical protein [Caudoviricetes sp.]